MATARFYDPDPIHFDNTGQPCAGGSITFYEADASTLLNVFAEPAMTTNLGSSVDLDASGRLESPVFIGESYCAQLKNASGVQQWLKEDLGATDAGAIEALDPADGNEDDVYRTDGTDAYWGAIREVPDPTGQTGDVLYSDGEISYWGALPAAAVYDEDSLPGGIEQGATSFQIGKLLVQFGTGSAPTASAEYTTSTAVTFGTAYATLLHIDVTPTGSAGFTGRGTGVTKQVNGSTTGFTARFYAGAEHGSNDYNINATVNFTWVAYGLVA